MPNGLTYLDLRRVTAARYHPRGLTRASARVPGLSGVAAQGQARRYWTACPEIRLLSFIG